VRCGRRARRPRRRAGPSRRRRRQGRGATVRKRRQPEERAEGARRDRREAQPEAKGQQVDRIAEHDRGRNLRSLAHGADQKCWKPALATGTSRPCRRTRTPDSATTRPIARAAALPGRRCAARDRSHARARRRRAARSRRRRRARARAPLFPVRCAQRTGRRHAFELDLDPGSARAREPRRVNAETVRHVDRGGRETAQGESFRGTRLRTQEAPLQLVGALRLAALSVAQELEASRCVRRACRSRRGDLRAAPRCAGALRRPARTRVAERSRRAVRDSYRRRRARRRASPRARRSRA
jgi:hypothetical protein